jgi:small subunit ribosomal protein SAe
MSLKWSDALNPTDDDILKMLACEVHKGSSAINPNMKRYVWKKSSDRNAGYIINIHKTWQKLMLAARVIASIENPSDVCAISARQYGQRAVLKFAHYTGAQAFAARYTPGTFTNQIQKKFVEPRLLIVTDPMVDSQPITESSYVNVPVIAFCNVDSPLNYVDIAIPCNNRSKKAIGLMWWLLSREVLRLKRVLDRDQPWGVMIDMFIYRDPEEQERDEKAALAEKEAQAAHAQAENENNDNVEQQWVDPNITNWSENDNQDWSAVSKDNWDNTVGGEDNWDNNKEAQD